MAKENTEIKDLKNKIKELEYGWKRTQADFENHRKRTEQERRSFCESANLDLIQKLLPVLDNFRRASTHIPAEIKDLDWTKGMLMIEKHLEDILSQEGLHKMDIKPGNQFDPYFHEAILTTISKDFKPGQIVEVVEDGFKFGEKIVRPAKVQVAK